VIITVYAVNDHLTRNVVAVSVMRSNAIGRVRRTL
jgi:hypothetical protein